MNSPNHDPAPPAPPHPLLLAHEADGIKELDNLLPRWWVWLFYLTTAFAVVYMLYYHVFKMGDLQAAANSCLRAERVRSTTGDLQVAADRGPFESEVTPKHADVSCDTAVEEDAILTNGDK